MLDTFLVPEKTVANAKGDGPAVDLRGASHRAFLATLRIAQVVEQEALEVSIYTSADGTAWSAKPLITFPQRFYAGDTPLILDFTANSEVAFIRAHWEPTRWGRGSETPMFEFAVSLKEIPPSVLQEATAEAHTRV
jgi:hypothetical protein